MDSAIKQRYLNILSSGVFVKATPEWLEKHYNEVSSYMLTHKSKLDASELFDMYELQFYLLLLTCRDLEAKLYLDRFNDQFAGKKSQKLAIMRLKYYEAIGDEAKALAVLRDDPDELRASRRLMTLSRRRADGLDNCTEYIRSLIFYLSLQSSDALVWAELGDVYHGVGEYEKAVYCYKEVLLQEPHAYNMFYKAGLSLYYQFLKPPSGKGSKKEIMQQQLQVLEHSRDCFLRAVEISESYTKGWVGVYTVSTSDFIGKLRSEKAFSGLAFVDRFVLETEKLAKLSKSRIMTLEHLEGDKEFEDFLKE